MIKINKSKKSSPLSKGRGKTWIHSRNFKLHDWVIARSWSKVGIGFYFCWVNFYFSVMIRFCLSSRGEAVAIQDKIVLYLKSIWIAKQPLCGHCFATARNDSRSSRVSETNVAIQIFNRQVCFQSRLLRYRSQWRSKEIWIASLSLAMTGNYPSIRSDRSFQ